MKLSSSWRKEDLARDPELAAMAAQYFDALNSASPDSVKRAMPKISSVPWIRKEFMVISWWFHGDVMVISWCFHGDFMVMSWWFHGDIMVLSWWFHGDFIVVSWWFHSDFMVISSWFHGGSNGMFHAKLWLNGDLMGVPRDFTEEIDDLTVVS